MANAGWNKDTRYALGWYRGLIRILGIWPLDSRGLFSTLRILIVISIQIILVAIFVQNWIVKGNCGTITELVDAVSLITTSLMAVIKILLPSIHRNRVSSIVNSALQDWSDVEDKKSWEIMRRYAYIGRLVFIVQMFGAYMTIIPLILMSLPKFVEVEHLDNKSVFLRNIPIGPKCWVSLEISALTYFLYYIFVCLHLFILATAYLGGDVFAFGLAMHLCGQFQLLYRSLDELDGDETESIQRARVARFSKRHNQLLKLADDFEAAFHMLIFFELGANTFIISISEIILLWACKVGDTQIISAMAIRIYLMYIQIFMYSYIGEHLSTQAEKLQVAIYNSPWYGMSPAIVRDMKFIMMRNNYLFHLTAGKIWNMDYENFKSIVRSMFSYFSILRLILNE
ncbi:odorant receptor 47b-like [Diachasma alloeum]|uniref:Odorant receptor n=1 Tax=Diachasma alloeum TaxID=454923 RepID=A0A4E0RNU8_9HYME|nr:odorant receptor 47b-like [Diachasma alloeum]THK33096.1 odorant receptor 31 [Diachasma alloeum]